VTCTSYCDGDLECAFVSLVAVSISNKFPTVKILKLLNNYELLIVAHDMYSMTTICSHKQGNACLMRTD